MLYHVQKKNNSKTDLPKVFIGLPHLDQKQRQVITLLGAPPGFFLFRNQVENGLTDKGKGRNIERQHPAEENW